MNQMTNFWLSPVKKYSWQIIIKHNVFGVQLGKAHLLDELKISDYIIFYCLRPVDRVVGIGKVVSKPYIGNENLWNNKTSLNIKYPYRVKLDIKENQFLKNRTIRLYEIIGYENKEKNYIIEPYLKTVALIKLNISIISLFTEKIEPKTRLI